MNTNNTQTGAGATAARIVKISTCYTTADENGVAVIGAEVTWNDGTSAEMTWPNVDAFCAFRASLEGPAEQVADLLNTLREIYWLAAEAKRSHIANIIGCKAIDAINKHAA